MDIISGKTLRTERLARVLIDIAHPAHVHFYKYILRELIAKKHEVLVVARNKDVTLSLLENLGIDYMTIGGPFTDTRWGQLGELVQRVFHLYKIGRQFRPDLILTRNPSGVIASTFLGVTGIFDTDDGRAAGIHFMLAAPFSSYITSPDCMQEYYGRKHVKYPGYKQSAYLHPDVFRPDSSVRERLELTENESFYLVRFVAMSASHDRGEQGIDWKLKEEVIEELMKHGKVFISSEIQIPKKWQHLEFPLSPHEMHDALAFADMLVGDSQSMAAEAAVLGIPNVRMSSFVGRISYLNELEHRYQLTYGFLPSQKKEFLQKIRDILARKNSLNLAHEAQQRMLKDKINIVDWYVNWLKGLARH